METDEEARDCISKLVAAADSAKNEIDIQPGDMLIFNNNRGLHGRGAIVGDRLILRTYVKKNLNKIRELTRGESYLFDINSLVVG
ncbi:hypothetical protein GS501_09300 [Saccharibacter sp. 17.LH.SD]|uniref:TauD/TfdA family dioxygenase n=1 Tax=Saccharibacter sp. 17.LH.SD TaxID=2689393 RepID=UPI00136C687E|nr:TauD/TfdA family dioxygenase [Saccharibacter sp. 17.LH.SD]MXV45227.1 hypothetical protein [Saccharibacter sp. 17.LH.SD]